MNIKQYTINYGMAWLMYKNSDEYHYRGKKCANLEGNIRSKIDLSWGMDSRNNNHLGRLDSDYAQQNSQIPNHHTQDIKPNYYTNRRGQEQELQKIMKKFKGSKNQSYRQKIAKLEDLMVLQDRAKDTDPVLHNRNDALNKFVNGNSQSKVYGNPISRNKSAADMQSNNGNRIPTQQSHQKFRYFQGNLALQPIYRRDTIGTLLDSQKSHEYDPMVESRITRRSSSGNKKNQSIVILGDGKYNQFTNSSDKAKDFHTQLQQMYKYEQKRNNRRVSQLKM